MCIDPDDTWLRGYEAWWSLSPNDSPCYRGGTSGMLLSFPQILSRSDQAFAQSEEGE
ncbi:hypothetical protein SAMN04489751_0423 [Brevibacterium sandarakinum]|uniref:Uncharacterized protein n=2 Tax=Brevibacterium TaxID=1696 RepID=A0A1H1LTU3_BRESA|nr:hypothetical protein SAMN04489751_0423 [Brevibacterium sandarakinum]